MWGLLLSSLPASDSSRTQDQRRMVHRGRERERRSERVLDKKGVLKRQIDRVRECI